MNASEAATPSSTLADYAALSKPRLNTMVLATTLGGAWLAGGGNAPGLLLAHAVLGTGCVAVGASALNQVMERVTDGRMLRTATRPLPAGRLHPADAMAFGLLAIVGGVLWLAVATTALAAFLAGLTAATYLLVYTPMKARSAGNTLVGAVPGALPPVIGWTAVSGEMGAGAWFLFAVLYLWQIPHFLAIAWLYRRDYEQAGLVMLPSVDEDGSATARHAVTHAVALLLASLFPLPAHGAGTLYGIAAVVLGTGYIAAALYFRARRTDRSARILLRASLIYLPLLFGVLVMDR